MKISGMLFVLVIALSTICQAKTPCSWVNDATAFGALGVTVDSPGKSLSETSATTCTFTYQDKSILRRLRVDVLREAPPASLESHIDCGSRVEALQAIGNAAVACSREENNGLYRGMASGRVRDMIFTIKLEADPKDDPLLTPEMVQKSVKVIAAQVAGNLF